MPKLYKREKYLSRMRGFYHANDIIKVLEANANDDNRVVIGTAVEK